ncbi:rhodanese-like domain-containing protein [Sporomusa aerivorans]|uniref:rhodanese-like domain-containing protein n=1 Tax=Sporomusa aerivorans TaxID=204936 RepID=UPI00352A0AA1
MKTRLFLLVTLILTFTLLPVSAHEAATSGQVHSAQTPGGHDANASIHHKIDQLLKSIPENHSFIVPLESKTANDLLLAVRTAENFQKSPVPDALNVSLADLHAHLKNLPKDKRVLVIGDSTVDGAYATFILRLHGIEGWLIKSDKAHSGCPLAESQNKKKCPKCH